MAGVGETSERLVIKPLIPAKASRCYRKVNRKQGEWIEANIPEEGGGDHLSKMVGDAPTLADVGIGYHDSPKFRILAQIPVIKTLSNLTIPHFMCIQ